MSVCVCVCKCLYVSMCKCITAYGFNANVFSSLFLEWVTHIQKKTRKKELKKLLKKYKQNMNKICIYFHEIIFKQTSYKDDTYMNKN